MKIRENRMLNKIKLNNFKCYKNETFSLSNLTVFCGNNSVGKSTAIQALLLAFQNNFSSELELYGDFVELGSYQDIHNRDAEFDSLLIDIHKDGSSLKWGYTEEEFGHAKREQVEDAPLPIISSLEGESVIQCWNEQYADNFIFLSAERWGPRRNYPYSTQRRSPSWLGIHGEFTPQVLNDITSLSKPLANDDARSHSQAEGPTVADNLYKWMGEISPGVFIKTKSDKEAGITTSQYAFGEHTYRAVNVGFGLSYSLPVVLALLSAKPGGLVIIENPEAHLHPKGQSYLGRLIALTAQSGVQVIIETHSDHLLNGMRLIARVKEDFDPNIFTLHYVYKGGEESNVDTISLAKDGKLSNWPKGFFDQQAQDMFTIMTGRTEMPGSQQVN